MTLKLKNGSGFFLRLILLLLSATLLLTGCRTQATRLTDKLTAQKVAMPQSCGGWEKIDLKNSSRYYLLRHDQRLVVNIDAHNLRGRNLGCWQ